MSSWPTVLCGHVAPAEPSREKLGTFAGKIRKGIVPYFAVVAKQGFISSSSWGEHPRDILEESIVEVGDK